MTDLSESIKDGRYYEQKGRLKQSGLRYVEARCDFVVCVYVCLCASHILSSLIALYTFSNVVYLIEGALSVKAKPYSHEAKSFKRPDWTTLPVDTLEAAIASTA